MRTKIPIAIVLVLTILALLPDVAPAFPRLSMLACQDLRFRDTGRGDEATPVSCAREFATSVPYVVMYLQLDDVDMPTTMTWELFDPSDESYAKSRVRFTPPNDYYAWVYYFYMVLPVTATTKEIVERNPRLRFSVIEVGAKPVSQIPGQWKLRVSLDGRPAGTLTFWLKP